MADVNRDRAQLLIVGGLALAVALVGVGLVLNFAIYTENLATREGNAGASIVVGQEQATLDSVARAIEYVNSHTASDGATRATINQRLQQQVLQINNSLSRAGALSGAYVAVTGVEPLPGARLAHQNASRNFTSKNVENDWYLTNNTSNIGRFTMEVYRPSLADSASTTLSELNMYHVWVTEKSTGNTWKTYIYRSSTTGAAYLATEDPGDLLSWSNVVYTCTSYDRNVTIDFTAGTFGGTNCSELDYFDQVTPPYEIKYDNGHLVNGTYEILLNSTNYTASNFHDPSLGKSPYAHNATFSARIGFEYVGNQIRYRNTRTIHPVPNVTRFPGLTPDVIQFDVSEDLEPGLASDAKFNVSWRVRDTDHDLESVNITLIDVTNEEVDAYRKYTRTDTELSKNGGSDDKVPLDGTGGDKYAIRITVIDGNGNVVKQQVIRNDK